MSVTLIRILPLNHIALALRSLHAHAVVVLMLVLTAAIVWPMSPLVLALLQYTTRLEVQRALDLLGVRPGGGWLVALAVPPCGSGVVLPWRWLVTPVVARLILISLLWRRTVTRIGLDIFVAGPLPLVRV